MIGLIIPAHNEEQRLAACLHGVAVAASHPQLLGEPVVVVVAADACSDRTGDVASAAGAVVVPTAGRCVGAARRTATAAVLERGARWIASTDADSVVAPDWLAQQALLARAGWDAVCGVVEVGDWLDHSETAKRSFAANYFAVEGHRHVHGASLGVSATAYLSVGGWAPTSVHEDVELVDALVSGGFRVARSSRMRVVTSARRDARARGGFGDHLESLTSV